MVNLSHLSTWIWLLAALIFLFLILRFFSHIVAHIFHFVVNFFWHGCAIVVVLIVVYLLLRSLHLL